MSKLYISDELKKRFLLPFREIFAVDPDFPYNKDDISKSSLLISGKYAKPEGENFLPQIIVSVAGYNTVSSSIFNNFQSEVKVNPLAPSTITGAKFTNTVNFSVVVDCLSTVKAESERLADVVFSSLNSDHVWMFQGLGMNILGLAVTESVPRQQYPQYNFMTSLNVQGSCPLTWTTYASPQKDAVLKRLQTTITLDLSQIDP